MSYTCKAAMKGWLLDVGAEHLVGLLQLLLERSGVLEQMKKLGVVHLEQHSRELPSCLRKSLRNKGVQMVSQNLLLALRLGLGKQRGKRDTANLVVLRESVSTGTSAI